MIEPAECANVIRQAEQPTSAAVENDDRAASVDAVAGGEFVDDRIRL